jgi:hypothetical protein
MGMRGWKSDALQDSVNHYIFVSQLAQASWMQSG